MDLFAVDRAVAAAVTAHRRAGEATDWNVHRAVAGQRALRELEQLTPSRIEEPLKAALLEHITRLTALRVGQEVEVRVATAFREARGIVRLERDESLPWAELFRGLLASRAPGEARAYLAALAQAAPPLAEPLASLRQTREEVLRRLGVEDAAGYFLGVPHAALVESARSWLALSRDLAHDVTRRRGRATATPTASGELEPWPLDLDVRLGRSAALGWPARLGWRSVAELFAGLPSNLPLALGAPPAAVGAASFARALFDLGASFRRAASPRGTPFALREPPLFTDALRTGALFAAATTESAFHRRALGLAAGPAADQARALAACALLASRFAAGCMLLGEPKSDHEEISAALFGAPLPDALRGVWPRATDMAGARWLATWTAPARYLALRDREGDDWFRSPRAFDALRERFGALEDDAAAEAAREGALAQMARAFEERLG